MSSGSNEGWEERYEDVLLNPSIVRAGVYLSRRASDHLSPEERCRVWVKLDLIAALAHKLAIGMIKGTLKYPTDDWTDKQWGAYAEDEENDLINYRLLKAHARRVKDTGG